MTDGKSSTAGSFGTSASSTRSSTGAERASRPFDLLASTVDMKCYYISSGEASRSAEPDSGDLEKVSSILALLHRLGIFPLLMAGTRRNRAGIAKRGKMLSR